MKYFFAVLLCGALAANAQQQQHALGLGPVMITHRPAGSILNGGTNYVAPLSTNSYNVPIVTSEFSQMGLQVTLAGNGPTTDTATVRLRSTLDLISYESFPSFAVSVPLNGTALRTGVGVFEIEAEAAFKITIENPTAVALTNIAVCWTLKAPKITVDPIMVSP